MVTLNLFYAVICVKSPKAIKKLFFLLNNKVFLKVKNILQ